MKFRGVVPGALVVLAVASAVRADGERGVSIELKTGEHVTGTLVGFTGDSGAEPRRAEGRRYRVKIGDSTIGIREDDIKRIEFTEPPAKESPRAAVAAPATPSLTEPLGATLTAADILASLSAPRGVTRGTIEVHGSDDVTLERKLPGIEGSPTFGAVYRGLVDYAKVSFTDRAAQTVRVYHYGSAADTDAPFVALYGSTSFTFASLARSGRFVATLEDSGAIASNVTALANALARALAPCSTTPVYARSEPRRFSATNLVLPKAFLPAGIDSVDMETPRAPSASLGPPPAHHVTYRGRTGSVAIDCLFRSSSLDAPSSEVVKGYAWFWSAFSIDVGVRVTGTVSPAALDALISYVESELAYASDTMGARLLRSQTPAPPAAPIRITLADLVPKPEELPPDFRVEEYRTSTPFSYGFEREEASLILRERSEVAVDLLQAREHDEANLGLVKAKMLENQRPADVLSAGDVFIAIRDNGVGTLTLAGREALVQLLAKKLGALVHHAVQRDSIPLMAPALDAQALALPAGQLPAGVTCEGTRTAAPVGTFARASRTCASVSYALGTARIHLRLLEGEKEEGLRRPIGSPAPGELRGSKAVWLAERKAVLIQTAGEVPAETLQWFVAFVEAELKRYADTRDAKRLELPKARLLRAADAVPRIDELPSCVTVDREETWTARELELEVDALEAKSPTKGPVLRALHAKARGRVVIHYRERAWIILSARRYESSEAADAAIEPTRRALPHFFAGAREIFQVENVIVVLEDQGGSSRGWEALRAAVVKHLATLGEVRAELVPFVPSADLALVVSVPQAWLPSGSSLVADAERPKAVDAPVDAHVSYWAHATYRGAGGMVELRGVATSAPLELVRSLLRPYRYVWTLPDRQRVITLRTIGPVAEDVVKFFSDQVDAELARCEDGKDAKKIDVAKLPRPEQPRVGEVYVFRITTKDGVQLKCDEIRAVAPQGARSTVREWPEDEPAKGIDREVLLADPDALRADETAETVEISGRKIACARNASGEVRPLALAFPFQVKRKVNDGQTVELVEIRSPAPVDLPVVEGLATERAEGAILVKSVAPGSRAEKLGFKAGDRIVLSSKGTGEKSQVVVERGGEQVVIVLD